MRLYILAAALMLAAFAMPTQAEPTPDVCDTAAGDALEDRTGSCGGTVEPWQCLGGSGSSRTVSAGPFDVVIMFCSPPPGTIPPLG